MTKPQRSSRTCLPCEGGVSRLKMVEIKKRLRCFQGWRFTHGTIIKKFHFKNYDETALFVNGVIKIAKQEDHHPDIFFGYRECRVIYSTHSVKGITGNDFICAAKIDALI